MSHEDPLARAAQAFGIELRYYDTWGRAHEASPEVLRALLGSLGYGAAEAMFGAAFGVWIDGVLLAVESATKSEVGGTPYLYRLVLRAPVSLAV